MAFQGGRVINLRKIHLQAVVRDDRATMDLVKRAFSGDPEAIGELEGLYPEPPEDSSTRDTREVVEAPSIRVHRRDEPIDGFSNVLVVRDVRGCARCGGDHAEISARRLQRPFQPPEAGGLSWTHWAPCPDNGEPILLIVDQPSPGDVDGSPPGDLRD